MARFVDLDVDDDDSNGTSGSNNLAPAGHPGPAPGLGQTSFSSSVFPPPSPSDASVPASHAAPPPRPPPHNLSAPPPVPPLTRSRDIDVDGAALQQQKLQQQHLLLLKKLHLLSPDARNGRWADALHPREPPGIMDPSTFKSPATDALQCYPIVAAVASSIDLNTLDALSRTCRVIHHGLLQYRSILLQSTLHCTNEAEPINSEETLRYRARAGNWFYMEDGRSYNGKSGDCARDMVGECRRCGEVVCRNCAIKPPAPVALRERHRRLCKACSHAPIATLAKPPLDAHQSLDSEAVQRAICKCETEGVWLCQPCGRSIRGADHDYQRIWRWRSQYGEILGGLGTGIGEGDRGVVCGREQDCCVAKECEQQLDCDAEDARDGTASSSPPPPASDSNADVTVTAGGGGEPGPVEAFVSSLRLAQDRTPSPMLGPGYARHEIEGIGGVVKRKRVVMVRIGACVPEWEDERGSGSRVLGREVRGARRSWCGWCCRAIPGDRDLGNSTSASSSLSGGSRRASTSTAASS